MILMLHSWGKSTSGFPDGMAAGKVRFRKAPKAAGRNDKIPLLLLFPSSLQLHYNGSGLKDLNAEHTNQFRYLIALVIIHFANALRCSP